MALPGTIHVTPGNGDHIIYKGKSDAPKWYRVHNIGPGSITVTCADVHDATPRLKAGQSRDFVSSDLAVGCDYGDSDVRFEALP